MGRSSGRSRASHATAPVTNAVGRCGSPKRRYSIARSTSGPMAWSSTLRRTSWPQSSGSTCRRVALWPFSEDPHDSIAVRRVRPAHRPERPHHGGPPRRVSRRERRGIPRPRRRVSRRHRARARSRRLADARRLRGRGVQPRTPEQELRPDGAERRPDRVRDVVLRSGGSTAGTGPRVAVTPRRRPGPPHPTRRQQDRPPDAAGVPRGAVGRGRVDRTAGAPPPRAGRRRRRRSPDAPGRGGTRRPRDRGEDAVGIPRRTGARSVRADAASQAGAGLRRARSTAARFDPGASRVVDRSAREPGGTVPPPRDRPAVRADPADRPRHTLRGPAAGRARRPGARCRHRRGVGLTREGEIAYVQLDLSVANLGAALDVAKQVLEQAGAPRGSELRFEREGQAMVVPFGTSEALAIYLDGTGLPDDVYTRCNINELVERVDAALGGSEKIRGSWSGPRETSLYLYGPSADAMFDKLQSVFADYPLCQNAPLVIRHGNPALDSPTVPLPFPRG